MKFLRLTLFLSSLGIIFLLGFLMVINAINEEHADLKTTNLFAIQGSKDILFPIYLANASNFTGIQMKVSYPPEIDFKRIILNSELPNATIVVNNSTIEELVIAILYEESLNVEEEKLFEIYFDINNSAPIGEHSIGFSEVVIGNIKAEKISEEITNGTITIVEPYNLTYLPPISLDEIFTLTNNSTLPLKFNVTNAQEAFIADDSAKVRIFNLSLGIDKIYNTSEEEGNYIQIDLDEALYITNIHTNELNMPLGNYTIEVTFSNFQKEIIGFGLVEPGKGRGKK